VKKILCSTQPVLAAERQNSATPGRGLEPTRDFPANPWRSPALAAVIMLADLLMSSPAQVMPYNGTHGQYPQKEQNCQSGLCLRYAPAEQYVELVAAAEPSRADKVKRTPLPDDVCGSKIVSHQAAKLNRSDRVVCDCGRRTSDKTEFEE
jgi:hypothetical protein